MMMKKVFEIYTSGQFHKKNWHNLCHYWHIALSSDSSYAARGVNFDVKSFVKLRPLANFIKKLGIIYATIGILL
jgi:hypothetical protein